MNKRRLIEWGKTLLIVLLTVSAIKLSGASDIVEQVFGTEQLTESAVETGFQETEHEHQAAKPMTIMITTAENAHHGVKYGSEALDEAYGWFTASLGEALGSSGEPVQVSQEQWESALHGSGVFFDYLYDQSLASVANWLGVEISSDASLHTSRRLCLTVEDSGVALYYIRALDGKAYRCETALNSASLESRLAEYVPNGAMFIFETGGSFDSIDPYYAILPQLDAMDELTAENPLQEMDDSALLSPFGMNALVANRYVESDGVTVYVEGEKSLRVSTDGRMVYNCMDGEQETQPEDGTPDAIETAYELVNSLPCSDEWRLQMSYISYDADTEEYTVRFDYVVDGAIVCFEGRQSAMEIVINGSCGVVRADLLCRSYTASGSATPMPELQALAVVTTLGGGEPMLAYTDNGENVSLGWVIKN
ncbi:MAG: hypothetical protein AB7D36_10505 [Oscillospiraceae bacterium]